MGRGNQYKPYQFYYARNGRLDLFGVVDLMTDRALVAGIGWGDCLTCSRSGDRIPRNVSLRVNGITPELSVLETF
jgi:hypothetical protein